MCSSLQAVYIAFGLFYKDKLVPDFCMMMPGSNERNEAGKHLARVQKTRHTYVGHTQDFFNLPRVAALSRSITVVD